MGIGFGPIQSGLFLLEAANSGNFERMVVAEVMPEVVAAVRRAGGQYSVNIAEAGGIRTQQIEGVEIYSPLDATDRRQLVDALSAADEIATALPSVDSYRRGEPSPAVLLAEGFERKVTQRSLPAAVVYAAENHNRAAELLHDAVRSQLAPSQAASLDDRVQFVNTVIGKMSGTVSDPIEMERDGLAPLVEGGQHAILVEQFNHILVGQIGLAGFERGIRVFQERPDLLPYEEAKLYGHNAAHALLGYLAHRRGLTWIYEAHATDLLELVEQAFLIESGGTLVQRYIGVDPIFTPVGWSHYVQDLLTRMVNPYLRDRVDRVIRDPRRKLGWDDRLIGTMRMALKYDIEPWRYALGAAAALELLQREQPEQPLAEVLESMWDNSADSQESRNAIFHCLRLARHELQTRFRG